MVDANSMEGRIAVVGLALAFPGASDIETFWRNLVGGVESIEALDEDSLRASGVPERDFLASDYVRAASSFGRHDLFDADFFDIPAREAEIIDPQQRLLLELTQHALDDSALGAGVDALLTGVFVGVGPAVYLNRNLLTNRALVDRVGVQALLVGNEKSFAASRIAYKFGFEGPCMALDTACSTSLYAVHSAVRSLQSFECDLAVAGAASMMFPKGHGYEYVPGGILSSDGHCRPFGSGPHGTIFASGGGIILLRRLEDALRDGNRIHAIIRGVAVNSDGNRRVGFVAPSVERQTAVIKDALIDADLDPGAISYLECHGTGTAIGDPIEIRAASRALKGDRSNLCAIGSVKGNFGHLDAAAGMAGLIKVMASMRHGVIPPTLHSEPANPALALDASPFRLAHVAEPWTSEAPLRAGVSAFGLGGSNAHVVVEQAPVSTEVDRVQHSSTDNALVLSARSLASLDSSRRDFAEFLDRNRNLNLIDVEATLVTGRRELEYRYAVVADTHDEAIRLLGDGGERLVGRADPDKRIALLFPGQGSQYWGMGAGLLEEPAYAAAIAECTAALERFPGSPDLRGIITCRDGSASPLVDTLHAQLGLFATGYAYARLLESYGVQSDLLLGHSIGEVTAACLAGVFSPSEAVALVHARGTAMRKAPHGAMLNVALDAEAAASWLEQDIWISVCNSPAATVFGGSVEAIGRAEQRLREAGIPAQILRTAHAFHTPLMDGVLDEFRGALREIEFTQPARQFVSNVTGELADPEQAATPEYWVHQLRQPVRFAEGLRTIEQMGISIGVECGPPGGIATFAAQTLPDRLHVVTGGRSARLKTQSDMRCFKRGLAELWVRGVSVRWQRDRARRIPVSLPGYAFARQEHWIPAPAEPPAVFQAELENKICLQRAVWTEEPIPDVVPSTAGPPIAVLVAGEKGRAVANRFRAEGHALIEDGPWDESLYTVGNGAEPADLESGTWLKAVGWLAGREPKAVIDLRLLEDGFADSPPDQTCRAVRAIVEPSLQALVDPKTNRFPWIIGCQGNDREIGVGTIAALVDGLGNGARGEAPGLRFCVVEIENLEADMHSLLAEALLPDPVEPVVRIARGSRLVRRYEDIENEESDESDADASLIPGGCYLITGGLGGIGSELAVALAERFGATVIAASRSANSESGQSRANALRARVEAAGGTLLSVAADISTADGVAALRSDVLGLVEHVDVVVHAAAQNHFGPLNADPASDEVYLAKVNGTAALLNAFADDGLKLFVAFSSTAAHIPAPWQSGYAAANAVMTTLVANSVASIPAVTISWDVWREVGMAADVEVPTNLDWLKAERLKAGLGTNEAIASFFDVLRIGQRGEFVVARDGWRTLAAVVDQVIGNDSGQTVTGFGGMSAEEIQEVLVEIWREVIGGEAIELDSNFFEQGGDSFLLLQVQRMLTRRGANLTPVDLFRFPTIRGLATHLAESNSNKSSQKLKNSRPASGKIAIVGYSGRFPGAATPAALHSLLCEGRTTFVRLDEPDLLLAGLSRAEVQDPRRVRVASALDDIAGFDADFFGMSAHEAAICDPQQRLFLELAHFALERSALNPEEFDGRVGVYASTAISTYLFHNLWELIHDNAITSATALQVAIGNDANFFASRAAYKLGLSGPAITVSTACSSSLTAIHLASRALLAGECEAALAGGVRVDVAAHQGYLAEDGGIASRSGICRVFDERSDGTIFGSGGAVVLLKRLEDAIDHGDVIHAVIAGSAINNDGADKVGYTAPSAAAQASVISAALEDSGYSSSEIDYVECHGTGTLLGDPIEFAALSSAFAQRPSKMPKCLLGSIKGNIGHLDAAAGVAGLIKIIEALRHGVLPGPPEPIAPNPLLEISGAPFRFTDSLEAWPAGNKKRVAGLSSFGFGGTNVHAVIEEADLPNGRTVDRRVELLRLSASTKEGLEQVRLELASWIDSNPDVPIGDIARTLYEGRRSLKFRAAIAVCRETASRLLREQPVPQQCSGMLQIQLNDLSLFDDIDFVRTLHLEWPEFTVRFAAIADSCAAAAGAKNAETWLAVADTSVRPIIACAAFADACGQIEIKGEWAAEGKFQLVADYANGELDRQTLVERIVAVDLGFEGPRPIAVSISAPCLVLGSAHVSDAPTEAIRLSDGLVATGSASGAIAWAIDQLWSQGINFDRRKVWPEAGRFAELPDRPISKKRHWYEPRRTRSSATVPEVFQASWLPDDLHKLVQPREQKHWILLDKSELATALASLGRIDGNQVTYIDELVQQDEKGLSAEAFQALVEVVRQAGGSDIQLIATNAMSGSREEALAVMACYIELSKAFAKESDLPVPSWCLVTDGLQPVISTCGHSPNQALALGTALVHPLENQGARSAVLDVDLANVATEQIASQIANELAAGLPEPHVAYRLGQRFVRRFTLVPPRPIYEMAACHGPWLITGAFGGIGRAFAAHLAVRPGAKLLLVSRQAPSVESNAFIATLKAAGAQVEHHAVDVLNSAALTACLGEAEARLGEIRAVFHAAGISRGALASMTDMKAEAAVLAPKTAGTDALLEVLMGRQLEIIVLCSSLVASIGLPGSLGYASANAYLDALATARRNELPIVSVGWDMWKDTGMAAQPMVRRAEAAVGPFDAMVVADALAILDRVIGERRTGAVLVSLGSIERKAEMLRAGIANRAVAPGPIGTTRQPRPDLTCLYVAPTVGLESEIAEVWSETLGFDSIGTEDDFFELGGDSLVAARLAATLFERYRLEVSMEDFFEQPTVAGVAAQLQAHLEVLALANQNLESEGVSASQAGHD